jgi:hypothetical protein
MLLKLLKNAVRLDERVGNPKTDRASQFSTRTTGTDQGEFFSEIPIIILYVIL